jgi:hypothetical protein
MTIQSSADRRRRAWALDLVTGAWSERAWKIPSSLGIVTSIHALRPRRLTTYLGGPPYPASRVRSS